MLTTSVIGSYAWPSWFISAVEAMARGEFGPRDVEETLDDAVDLAIRDQEDAGVDMISDGEMRRLGFFTADFYGRLDGLRAVPPQRRLGPAGHDQREKYVAERPITAPVGLGLVAEYEYLRNRTGRPVKVPCPGPFTLAGRIQPGRIYKDRMEAAFAFSDIINAECRALAAAGVEFIQLDEPSMAVHSSNGDGRFIDLFNRTVAGVDAHIGLHLCFGNFVGRPVAHRTYAPLFPQVLDLEVDEIHLEFANREMAEIELIRKIVDAGKTAAAGLVDVKNYFIEPPALVAERIRTALKHAPADQLVVAPDCGFSQTARWAARAKLHTMVEGTRIVRRELGAAE